MRAQNKEGGWRYEPQPAYSDVSVTVAHMMALRAARNAGLFVRKSVVDAGVDFIGRIDQQFCARGNCADVGTTRQGFVQDDRTNMRTITANAISTASYNPFASVATRTSLGIQWVNNTFDRNGAGSSNLTPGASTISGGATKLADASFDRNKTFGVFLEEQVALRDRLFLTAAVRSDQNSAFGTNFQQVYYPKGSLSWIMSDESFFPKFDWLNQFRYRASFGSSGV